MDPSASYVYRAGDPAKDTSYGKGKHDNMFPTPQWRDLWAAILFYAHFALFIGAAVFIFTKALSDPPPPPSDGISLGSLNVPLLLTNLGVAILSGVVLTALCMNFMYSAPEGVLHGCFIANIVLNLGLSIMMFLKGGVGAGIVMSIMTVIGVIFYLVFRKRIPFSAVLLRTVIDGLRTYPSMLNVTAGSVVVTLLYSSFWLATVGGLGLMYQRDNDPDALTIILTIYTAFSFFWTSQVISNTVQTTIAGVYATYYFLHGTGQAIIAPTASSLRRATTYSFGSICFGSFVVAILQTMRFCVRMLSDDRSITGCIADCILGFIEGLVQYFNYYAYTQIAIYGKPYVQAAKDTWSLIKTRGVDAIVNDNIIGTCVGIATFTMAIFTGAVTYLISAKAFGQDWELSLAIAIACGLVTVVISHVAFEIIGAGATTTFVCLAEDPQALRRAKPELYNTIMEKYSMITI